MNFYPHGNGVKKEESPITISSKTVSLSAFRKTSDGAYMIRLINNCSNGVECDVKVFGKNINLSFGKYEVKTLLYKDEELVEQRSMLNV